ncbi:hypothetical protein C2869_07895 [Saccharobesus litoralis]|uniref:Uncharacterized protein n=1 Tax=Saccharobesus litoralis TaxID=2172099 RepID=A0A2S0VQ69_9ALTE|nr:hypothetical protein C2869_07895 [Saccharobesus litoralis]
MLPLKLFKLSIIKSQFVEKLKKPTFDNRLFTSRPYLTVYSAVFEQKDKRSNYFKFISKKCLTKNENSLKCAPHNDGAANKRFYQVSLPSFKKETSKTMSKKFKTGVDIKEV